MLYQLQLFVWSLPGFLDLPFWRTEEIWAFALLVLVFLAVILSYRRLCPRRA